MCSLSPAALYLTARFLLPLLTAEIRIHWKLNNPSGGKSWKAGKLNELDDSDNYIWKLKYTTGVGKAVCICFLSVRLANWTITQTRIPLKVPWRFSTMTTDGTSKELVDWLKTGNKSGGKKVWKLASRCVSCCHEDWRADDGWHIQGQRLQWMTAQARRVESVQLDSLSDSQKRQLWPDVRTIDWSCDMFGASIAGKMMTRVHIHPL